MNEIAGLHQLSLALQEHAKQSLDTAGHNGCNRCSHSHQFGCGLAVVQTNELGVLHRGRGYRLRRHHCFRNAETPTPLGINA